MDAAQGATSKQPQAKSSNLTEKESIMKKLTVIALSLIAAGAAMAEGLTREQVVAELHRARAANEMQLNSESLEFGRSTIGTASTRSRAEVLAELEQARSSGELVRVDREGYAPAIATGSTTTRAAVIAELFRARANGELAVGNRNEGGYAYVGPQDEGQAARLAAAE
jgi:rRNA maturation endonuclease Nob1